MRYRLGRGTKTLVSLFALAGVVIFLDVMPASGEVVPSEPPLATSSNVQLIGHIPGSAAGMNFKDHYAYVSGWGGITVLDIAQADAPQLVNVVPLPHFENEDVDLCGNTLLVVNDREARDLGSIMYVLSLANPAAPTVVLLRLPELLVRSSLADCVGESFSMWSLAMTLDSPLAWTCALAEGVARTISMPPSRMSLTTDPPER